MNPGWWDHTVCPSCSHVLCRTQEVLPAQRLTQWLQPEPPGVQGVPPGAHSSFAAVACWLSYFLLQSSPREPHIGRRTSLPCSSRKLLPAAISQEWIQARFWIELPREAGSTVNPLSASSSDLPTSPSSPQCLLSTQGQLLSPLPPLQVLL